MKHLSSIRAIFLISISVALTGCSGGGSSNSSTTAIPTVSISPHLASIAAGTSATFTATITNASPKVLNWMVVDPPEATVGNPNAPQADVGSPKTQTGGTTFVYTAPANPPIYITGSGTLDDGGNVIEGTVNLSASVPNPNSFGTVSDNESIVITAPSVSVGASWAFAGTPTVAVNKTTQFIGYAAGSTNNAITWQVNGVTGGSTAAGTIVHTSNDLPERADYTAPSDIPMTGNTVTITVISQADPTKKASVNITITPQ